MEKIIKELIELSVEQKKKMEEELEVIFAFISDRTLGHGDNARFDLGNDRSRKFFNDKIADLKTAKGRMVHDKASYFIEQIELATIKLVDDEPFKLDNKKAVLEYLETLRALLLSLKHDL